VLKVENVADIPVMLVDAPESMIQDESDQLAIQEIHGCAKIAMSEIKTKCIF